MMNYELIFWGNSQHNGKIFKVQKNTIRIIKEVETQAEIYLRI